MNLLFIKQVEIPVFLKITAETERTGFDASAKLKNLCVLSLSAVKY